ncbi:MAG: DUF4405 domain-containing protein [Oligoflexia bacterium]|nr:DUF4405 domain-containing protein [Oligoflexia bacterium]
MKKSIINSGVDSISFFCAILVVATGLVLAYTLPPGSGRMGLTWLSLARHSWSEIHFYFAMVLVGLMVVHLWLHWSFIKAQAWGHAGTPQLVLRRSIAGLGVALLLAVVLLSLWVPAQGGMETGQHGLRGIFADY